MAGSRGTACSWIEMKRLAKEVLPAVVRGDGGVYAALRCVDASTIRTWKRAAEVFATLEDNDIDVGQFTHFQPTHARVISQAFKSLSPWNDESTEAILELVESCETEKTTAKELKTQAKEKAWELKAGQRKRQRRPKKPTGQYDLLLCDPPWHYDFSSTDSREIENQYPTESVEDLIAQYPTVPAAKDSVMFMWATAPKLKEALLLLEAWGFEYKTHAIWNKGKIGMGYWFRGQHELLLVGTKGNFSPPDQKNRVSSVIEAKRGSHSVKPVKVYSMLEKMFPGASKCELFQRCPRKGWQGWGTDV